MSETFVAEPKKFNRWIPVFASIAIQLCLGTAYIWGVFQPVVTKQFGWSNAHAAIVFSLLLGVLTFGSTLGGKIQDKLRPMPVVIGGGIFLGLGFFLAKFTSAGTLWWLYITYGVLGGLGMGMIYTTTIACCQKWFPDKRGLISGIIVSALGFGGLVFTPVANALMKSTGVLNTFAWFGLIFFVVCTIGALFIKNPPEGYKPEGWTPPAKKAGDAHVQDLSPAHVLKTPQFYIITIALMLASSAGLMVIPFAKMLGISGGLDTAAATSGVMVISGFNSFGRLFWGWVSDKLGRKNTILLLLILAGISILLIPIAKMYMVLAIIGLVGFSYGGFLGVFPALTADYFGIKNMGTNYGMVLLGFGIGAIASSYIAGYYKDIQQPNTAFLIASAAAFVGAILMFFLKHPELKKED